MGDDGKSGGLASGAKLNDEQIRKIMTDDPEARKFMKSILPLDQ